METTKLVPFEQKYLMTFEALRDLKKQQDELAKAEKKIKDQLKQAMDEYGINSVKTELITISNVKGSETPYLDLEKLKAVDKECYDGLLEDYPTKPSIDLEAFKLAEPKAYDELLEEFRGVKVVKPSVRFTIK